MSNDDAAADVDPAGDPTDGGTTENGSAGANDANAADNDRSDDSTESADSEPTDGAESTDDTEETDDVPLSERVADHDEALGEAVADLEAELAEREAEVDDLTSKLARVKADFSNYKQRAKRKQAEIRERASESLVERIVPVRNDLLRALEQEEGSDLRPGVESTLEKFDEVLSEEGVDLIDPDPGDEVDPARHQVMLRVESDEPEGTVHEVYEPGYEMGDRVITEAQVTVSTGGD